MPAASVAAPVGDTLNQAWKNDKSKFGLKMLQKMGWTEGKGLGKHEDGVSEHVKVAKKSNNLGLGATHDSSGAAGWASAAVSFNGVLEALGKAYGGGAASAGDKKKADKKMKKKARKAEKRRRTKDGEDAADSSSSVEGAGAAVGPNGAAKAASSCPSRARRVRSKDVKGFSQADLRAILGQAATTANPSLPSYPIIRGGYRAGAAAPAIDSETTMKKKKKKRKRTEPASPSLDSPHRPRTRSMDETAAVELDVVPGKRPRSGSFSGPDGGEEAGGKEAAGGGASSTSTAPRKSKNKKKKARVGEGAGEVGGEEGSAVAASSGKETKRKKKSKKEKDR